MERCGLNDSSIITVDYHMVPRAPVDKRNGTDGRVERVKVYDITNDQFIDWNANEPKPPTGHNPFVQFMAAFTIGVGALGFMTYTLSLAFDPREFDSSNSLPPQVERAQER